MAEESGGQSRRDTDREMAHTQDLLWLKGGQGRTPPLYLVFSWLSPEPAENKRNGRQAGESRAVSLLTTKAQGKEAAMRWGSKLRQTQLPVCSGQRPPWGGGADGRGAALTARWGEGQRAAAPSPSTTSQGESGARESPGVSPQE